MPLYEYRCRRCGTLSEVWHGFGQRHGEPCAECAGELERVFHPAGIVFKGSGFYKTDSRKASSETGDSGKASGEKTAAEKASGDKATVEKSSSEKTSSTTTSPASGKSESAA